jgi:hypothetical protein
MRAHTVALCLHASACSLISARLMRDENALMTLVFPVLRTDADAASE